MSAELPPDAPAPRLCHLIKWADFDGYGFNLHAEKSRSGQFIGKVDEDSPAQYAGLREGDRIIEVNGVNIANENHRQVVERIKSIPNETKLLVVDEEADRWYKVMKIVVKSTQSNVEYVKTPVPRPSSKEPPSYDNISSNANGVEKNDSNEVDQHSPVGDATVNGSQSSSPSGSPSLEIKSNGNAAHHEEIVEEKTVEREEEEESPKIIKRVENSPALNAKETGGSRSSTPLNGSSIPDSPRSTKSSHSSGGGSSHNGPASPDLELNLNMSASEMRQILAARKKKDPKKAQMDIRQKFEIIQQM